MARDRPRPFLDPNVLFSGLYGPGPPAAILERHAEGELIIVVSRQVLDELVRTVQRKRPTVLPLLRAFLTNAPPEVTADPTIEEIHAAERCVNAKDAPILAAAIQSRVDCLVIGNSRHFTPEVARCAGIAIFTPADYLAHLAR